MEIDLFLREIEHMRIKEIGSKAYNLIKLNELGVKVPKTWIISNDIAIKLLGSYGFESKKGFFSIEDSKEIYNFFDSNFCSLFYNKMITCISEHMKENSTVKSYAIRSSHALEDGNARSYAGLFRTDLNLHLSGAIVNSILKCWRDCFYETYVDEVHEGNQFILKPCSIIVQEFIDCRTGGVLFRQDNLVRIASTWGLTKSVVDGSVGVDEWLINEENYSVIEKNNNKTIGEFPVYTKTNPRVNTSVTVNELDDKPKLRVVEGKYSERTVLLEFNEDYKSRLSLNQEDLSNLIKIARKASDIVGLTNCDIEWSINRKGQITILQIRPLTKYVSMGLQQKSSLLGNEGLGIVSGKTTGAAFYVENEDDAKKFPEGAILVAKRIRGPVMHAAQKASGCIVESRSPLSHSAIIARELGIPAIGAIDLNKIEFGEVYCIDGDTGKIEKSDDSSHSRILKVTSKYEWSDSYQFKGVCNSLLDTESPYR